MIQYNYTPFQRTKGEFDTAIVVRSLQPILLKTIRTTNELAEMRENDVKFIYRYLDKNGDYFFQIFITPTLYKKQTQ